MSAAPPPAGHGGRKPGPAFAVEARRVEPSNGWHRQAVGLDFSYSVLPGGDPAPRRPGSDRRDGARQRTRLRSGKIVAPDGQFIVECLIHNRSPSGCRLRLPTMVSPPAHVYLYEDQSGELFQGVVVWRKERDVGLRLVACATTAAHRALAGRMRRKFYTMGP